MKTHKPFFDRIRKVHPNIHPNDIGFLRMAKVIRPVLEKALINTK